MSAVEYGAPHDASDAVWLLARADADPAPSQELQQQAVDFLAGSPIEGHWNQGLLAGLRSPHPKVVGAVASAIVGRLERAGSIERQCELVEAVLDACFLNLSYGLIRAGLAAHESPSPEEQRRATHEHNSARLVEAIDGWLRSRPRQNEHIRSRLLARVGSIGHLPGTGRLAESLVGFQQRLSSGEGSDARAVSELVRARRFAVFTDPTANESALLPYLRQDRQLDVLAAGCTLFRQYDALLTRHSKEGARSAMLLAMANLAQWLDELPHDAESRAVHLGDVVQRARRGEPWHTLHPLVRLHLEAHHELVLGADDERDLLRALRERYDTPEAEDIFVAACRVLARLPLLRLRSDELEALVLALGKHSRSVKAWEALLELLGALITGIDDFMQSRAELEQRDPRRLRILRRTLAHDRRLRLLLERLATDLTLRPSANADTERAVRETAWRVLLRCLPPDAGGLVGRGLSDDGGRLFRATVEEAAHAHRRQLWDYVLPHWDELLAAAPEPAARRERALLLVDAFRRTLSFSAVQEGTEGPGRFVRLALDDPDGQVRQRAERALIEGGYGPELQRERQRRELAGLAESFEQVGQRLTRLESQFASQRIEANDLSAQRAGPSLTVQEQLQERDLLVTQGWVATAGCQVDLQELRGRIAQAMERLGEEEGELARLRQEMTDATKRERSHLGAIADLEVLRERERLAVDGLGEEVSENQSAQRDARGSLESLSSRREHLRANPPREPSNLDDPAANRAARNEYEAQRDRHKTEIAELKQEISAEKQRLAGLVQAESSLQARAESRVTSLNRLQSRIRSMEERTGELREERRGLQTRLERREKGIGEIRQEMAEIEEAIGRVRRRADATRAELIAALGLSQTVIMGAQAQLEGIRLRLEEAHRGLVETRRSLDDGHLEQQRLAQAITAGRAQYDRIGAEATRESGAAEARGASMMHDYELLLAEAHETLVHYVEGMSRALAHAPAPTDGAPGNPRRDAHSEVQGDPP